MYIMYPNTTSSVTSGVTSCPLTRVLTLAVRVLGATSMCYGKYLRTIYHWYWCKIFALSVGLTSFTLSLTADHKMLQGKRQLEEQIKCFPSPMVARTIMDKWMPCRQSYSKHCITDKFMNDDSVHTVYVLRLYVGKYRFSGYCNSSKQFNSCLWIGFESKCVWFLLHNVHITCMESLWAINSHRLITVTYRLLELIVWKFTKWQPSNHEGIKITSCRNLHTVFVI